MPRKRTVFSASNTGNAIAKKTHFSNTLGYYDADFYTTQGTPTAYDSPLALCTTPSIKIPFALDLGNADDQRSGQSIRNVRAELRGIVYADSTAVGLQNLTYALVYDRAPTDSLPSWSDVFMSNDPLAPIRVDNTNRFRVVYRSDLTLMNRPNTTGGSTTDGSTFNPLRAYKKVNQAINLRGAPTRYKSTSATGALGDVTQGLFYLMGCGDKSSGTTDATLQVKVRLYFEDY